jgi:ABC-2 type transport system permease protein
MTALAAAVAGKDRRELLRDWRLVVVGVLMVLLAITAIATAYARVSAYESDRVAAEAQDRQTWLSQGARNPHGAAHFSSWALRPMTAMSLLEPGVTPYAGSGIWMEAHKQNVSRFRPAQDSVSVFDMGSFSFAWILQVIAPLLLLVLGAASIARERERGTLRLMLASGVGASGIVVAKLRSTLGLAGAPLGVLTLLALLAVQFVPVTSVGQPVARLALWLALHAVFIALVVAIAISVSASSASFARALAMAAGVWLFATLLVPRVAAGLASSLAPVPSAEVFAADIARDRAALSDGHGDADAAFKRSVLARYNVQRVEDLPVSFAGLSLEESERQGNVVFDRQFARLENLYDRQNTILRLAGAASPLVSVQNISMALAGTDMASQVRLQRQAEAHRRKVITALNADMIANGVGKDFDYLAGPALWHSIPEFVYRPATLVETLREIWLDALILALWAAAAAALVVASTKRITEDAG